VPEVGLPHSSGEARESGWSKGGSRHTLTAKGNITIAREAREVMGTGRAGISEIVAKYGKVQNLISYVNAETLKAKHEEMPKRKASGVDKVTWDEYDGNLDGNIESLMARMKQFSYRPQPARRVYIPKADGKMRPLGIPSYEDKLVAAVMADLLSEVYECKFLDTSYGFRPGRGCHDAIQEMSRLIMGKVSYVLEADIKGFFDNVDQKWLMEFIAHDIEDKNFNRYIVRFLKSGIMEDGKYYESDKGTAQGSPISPILANVYLHYALDKWFAYKKSRREFRGEAHIIRYADDFVMLFQYKDDAEGMYRTLPERMAKFGLELAIEKTKILAFGRYAKEHSKDGRTETFDFLGFTFCNGKARSGKYRVHIQTSGKKAKAKRQAVKEWLREHMHTPIPTMMGTLNRKLQGHVNYYGISGNYKAVSNFFRYVKETCIKTLRRRGQKKPIGWEDFTRIWNHYIKPPRIAVDIWHTNSESATARV
jgi:group II intron reverse transcriptase/maturase